MFENFRIFHLRPGMLRALMVLLFGLSVNVPVLAADDYLSELEAEAEASASVPNEDAPALPTSDDASAEQLPRVAFERALQTARPSIYTFYGRLSDTDKRQVVKRYFDTSENMSKAANLTLDLYFKRQ